MKKYQRKPCFSPFALKDSRVFLCTQKPVSVCLSNFVQKTCSNPSFCSAKTIRPPDRWWIKMLIKQPDCCTGACSGGHNKKATLRCAVSSHDSEPQVSRWQIFGILTAGVSVWGRLRNLSEIVSGTLRRPHSNRLQFWWKRSPLRMDRGILSIPLIPWKEYVFLTFAVQNRAVHRSINDTFRR